MKKVVLREDFEGFDVHKRFEVIVDIIYTEDNFELGAKLNSITGQYGITDSDTFMDSVSHAFNAMLIELDFDDLSEENKFNFIFSGLEYYDLKQRSRELMRNDPTNHNDGQAENGEEDEEEDEDEDIENIVSDTSFTDSNINENSYNPKNIVLPSSDENRNSSLESIAPLNFTEIARFDNLIETYDEPDIIDSDFLAEEVALISEYFYYNETYPSIENDENDENDENEDDENDENDENDGDENDENDAEDSITFFVPMILVCYRKEKKADFFIFNPFFKKSFVNIWKLNIISYFTILNNYKDFFVSLKKFYGLRSYMSHLSVFNKFYSDFRFINFINDYSLLPITDKVLETYYDFDFNTHFLLRSKKKRRRRAFKSYFLRKRKQISSFLKSFKWFSYEVLFKFFMFKYVFFDIKIDYNELKKKILTVYSLMVSFKKKFARKYRRRKSFKRMVHRNKVGVKMSFIRQQFYEKKKKRK